MKNKLKIHLVYQGYDHKVSKCLDEALDLIYFSLQDLGHEVERVMKPSLSPTSEPDLYIINGWIFNMDWQKLPKHKTIIIQLENLITGTLSEKFNPDIFEGFHVWDYSITNKKIFRDTKLGSFNEIIWGYHSCLDFFEPSKSPNTEILFYGSLTPRRQTILSKIDGFHEVTCAFNQWGGKMDRLIEDSKCVANIGAYHPINNETSEGRILETLRLAYCINNGVLVVSEKAQDTIANEYWGQFIDIVPLSDIEETIAKNLYDDKFRNKRFELAERYRTETSMKENMKILLESTLKSIKSKGNVLNISNIN